MKPHAATGFRLDRRELLLASAALPLGAVLPSRLTGNPEGGPRIERIEVIPVRYPMTGYFEFFTDPRGSSGRAAVLVKIVADDGTVGWGQSVPIAKWSYETLETATAALREYYAPALIGHDAQDLFGAHEVMDRAIAPGFSTGMPITRAGIDIALHDLTGKIQGKGLHELWSRPRGGPLTLSWTLNPKTLDEADALIDEGWKRGYRNFNIVVAPDPVFDAQLAKLVRERVPDGFLWADANGGYQSGTALAAAPRLAHAGVDVLEAPVRPNQIHVYQALKRQGALPIYMDEGVVSPDDLRQFMELKMLDGVAMKPSRCGGLLPARIQIQMLAESGLGWLGSGLTDPDVSLAATLALYGAFGLDRPAALSGPQFLTADLLTEPLEVKDGTLAVPEGPGLGVEVDEDKLEALRIACGSTRSVHSATARSSFRFVEDSPAGALRLVDGERLVLAYRHGDQLAEGVPPDRRRSCYVHPICGLDGEVLTDDFPSDHLHHRGLSLMWPRMKVGETPVELWHIRGIRQRFDRWIERRVDASGAHLVVDVDWALDDGSVVARERAAYHVHPATEVGRAIDVAYRITVLERPIELLGAEGKGYGGLNLRFAPRVETVITTDAGVEERPSDRELHSWADLSARFASSPRSSGIAILVDPSHPGFPPPWTLRPYGDLNVAWPGVEPETLRPGTVWNLRYRLWVHRDGAERGGVVEAWSRYASD